MGGNSGGQRNVSRPSSTSTRRPAATSTKLHQSRLARRAWFESEPERYRDIARPVRLPKDESNPLERAKREQAKVLSGSVVKAFLEYLRERRPDLYGPAMLQVLCGLRVLEAVSLRECDVDFEQQTITITETAEHKPKTRSSYRTIPVPPFALSVLRDVIAQLPIGDRGRPIFLSDRGEPWAGFDGYCHALPRALQACWREAGIAELRTFYPHWFRAAFATGVRAQGADARVLQASLGHSRGDMLGLHYEQITIDQMKAVILPATEKFCQWGVVKNGDLDRRTHPSQEALSVVNSMELMGRLELPTCSLRVSCSTN